MGTNTLPGGGTPLRVLVVDDEAELGRSICRYFETENWKTCFAEDLETALGILQEGLDLDLVITDIYLEEGGLEEGGQRAGGHVLTEASQARVPPLPVILLTGRPSLDAALEGLRGHAVDFLTKPIAMKLLLKRAERAVLEQRLRKRLLELEQVNSLLTRILPNAIEAKDPTTRGHSDRVVAYADTLALKCAVSEEERKSLRLAAQLHDVGKIGIPEAILTKPGKLTREEYEIIREHPGIGYRILEPLDHLPLVRRWVYQHHERWDGKGYPEGLRGEEVALPGRILILAEVFDALATARSYKQPWSKDKIADYFEQDRGRHFDPRLSRIVAEGVRSRGTAFFRPGSASRLGEQLELRNLGQSAPEPDRSWIR
ncbi:MAG: HD domain-containing phosphohydrolase [Planctomycetota bacterium]